MNSYSDPLLIALHPIQEATRQG